MRAIAAHLRLLLGELWTVGAPPRRRLSVVVLALGDHPLGPRVDLVERIGHLVREDVVGVSLPGREDEDVYLALPLGGLGLSGLDYRPRLGYLGERLSQQLDRLGELLPYGRGVERVVREPYDVHGKLRRCAPLHQDLHEVA